MEMQEPAPITDNPKETAPRPGRSSRIWLGLSVCLNLLLALLLIAGAWFYFTPKNDSAKDVPKLKPIGIYQPLQRHPTQLYLDREQFIKRIYAPPIEWNPEAEQVTIGVIAPPYNEEGQQILSQIPEVESDTEGIVALYQWFISKKWNAFYNAFGKIIGNPNRRDYIYCDQAVRLFRTVLNLKRFISRAVIFEYGDGHGKSSHTFMEIWDPSQSRWLFFDPHYYLHSDKYAVAELIGGINQPIFDPAPADGRDELNLEKKRRQIVETAFREGWHLWYVENAVRGDRIEYHNPEVYPPPQQNSPEQSPGE